MVNHIAVSDEHDELRDQWRLIFWIAGLINLAGSLFYILAASGRKQAWADTKSLGGCFRSLDEDEDEDEVLSHTGLATGPSARGL